MNNLDIAGILRTYSEKVRYAKSTEQLREIIREMKQELDLRKVRMDNE